MSPIKPPCARTRYPWDLLTTQFQPCHPLLRIIPWLPISLRIKPQFLKQSELCPYFLSHELLPPHVHSLSIFHYFPELAMTPCPYTAGSLCLPAFLTPPFPHCLPANSAFKSQFILALPLNGLHVPSSTIPGWEKIVCQAWAPRLPLSQGNERGTGLTDVYLAHIRSSLSERLE